MTFAVGAVTGTVLSFEFGLLWPAFTGRFGQVFGVLFAIEGIFFFLEAIFIAIYIFGWRYLSPWAHFWSGVPVAISGIGGAFSVVAVNSWMNQPQGFSPTSGKVTSVDPWQVIFNPAVPYEVPHMILAAYLVAGFLVAGIYAVGMLRGRRDRIHRLGLLIPLTVAGIVTPVQIAVGDTAARAIAKDQPIKFAAMECVDRPRRTCPSTSRPLHLDRVKGGIGIPGFDSFLVGWSTSTQVTGLDSVPPDDRPPANTMLHWAFDTMVGIGAVLLLLGAWFGFVWWRRRDSRRRSGSCARARVSGVAAIVALECGWIVTEVGRQPWIVYQIMRTADAVTTAGGIWVTFVARARDLRRARRGADDPLRSLSRRWREPAMTKRCRTARTPTRPRPRWPGLNLANAVAVVLVVGVTMYAVFGGADFGAGFWDLMAGGGDRGRRPRALIEQAIGPVWEANHVWLIFVLVVLWTGFPTVFGSIISTLFIPLSLAAFGIVLRGSGFAFRHTARRARGQAWRRAALRRSSSVLTPFFMGTVVGAVAGGRVPVGNAAGDAVTSWLNPLSLVIGALFVATGAYLARGVPRQRRAPRRDARPRALLQRPRARRRRRHRRARGRRAGRAARATRAYVFDGLKGDGLPLVIALGRLRASPCSSCCAAGAQRGARVLAVGRRRRRDLGLGRSRSTRTSCRRALTIADAAAPSATLDERC